jgi:hypothetical protein
MLPWELINGFLFQPGTYEKLWRGQVPEIYSVIRLKCLLDEGPRFLWGTHPTSGSWNSACPHRRRAGMTVVPRFACKPCMIDAGASGVLVELAGSFPSSTDVRMIEVQASEVEAKNVVAGGCGVIRISPSAPKPHPRAPEWVTPQWEAPVSQEEPPTRPIKRERF